jgi:hypothetical protein
VGQNTWEEINVKAASTPAAGQLRLGLSGGGRVSQHVSGCNLANERLSVRRRRHHRSVPTVGERILGPRASVISQRHVLGLDHGRLPLPRVNFVPSLAGSYLYGRRRLRQNLEDDDLDPPIRARRLDLLG